MTNGAKWGLGIAAVGALGAGIAAAVYASRRSRGLAGPHSTVPVVGTTKGSDGKRTLTHYRSVFMPIGRRISLVQDRVYGSVQDPAMRKLALQITAGCPPRDGTCEARAIDAWMRANLRYTGDVAPIKLGARGPVESIDLFQSASFTAEVRGGDCDDHTIFGATMLALNGITPRLRVTSPVMAGSAWTHIYVVAGLPKENPTEWVALDSTLPGRFLFGVEAPSARKIDFKPYTAEVPA